MEIVEKIFKLKENNTTIKTELIAGLTTFFTMSYLFVLAPKLLASAGLDFGSSITATGVIAFISCLLIGFVANRPYAVAPFLGEIAFYSVTIVGIMGFSIKTVLAAVFIGGILLFLMSVFNLRAYIVEKIPEIIKQSFCIGLGLFFIFMSLVDIGIVNFTQNQVPLAFGDITRLQTILGILCFILIIVLIKKQVQGAVLISIFATTIVGILIKDVAIPSSIIAMPSSLAPSFFQLDFSELFTPKFLPIFFVIFVLMNIETSGSLIGLAYKDENRKQNSNIKKEMISDSLSVIMAPILGTTTTGAYLDSMTGMSAGGRTGLCSIIVGLLFLIGIVFSPILTIIPPYAYAPALLYVGVLLTSVIKDVDFENISEFATGIFIIATMIFTYNIGTGIILGFIVYPIIKLLSGEKEKINIVVIGLFILAILYFIFYPKN